MDQKVMDIPKNVVSFEIEMEVFGDLISENPNTNQGDKDMLALIKQELKAGKKVFVRDIDGNITLLELVDCKVQIKK